MGVREVKRLLFFVLIFLLLLVSVSAQEYYITNSQDWKDVYSVEIFANLVDKSSLFITGTRHASIIHYSLPESGGVEIISSVDKPYVVALDSILESQGITEVTENAYDNINLELARRLMNITRFIVIDDSYGYNALAVASFASMAGYYVLFADERTIGEVSDYLQGVNVQEILIYGQVDRDVKSALEVYNPEIINLGDRFDNNIEIVKKYLEFRPTQQVILTNGEFIEQSLMDGADPVLFIGKTNVPDQTQKFIKESDINIGILVGNELIGTATIIRRQVGISVFVKFAQGARIPGDSISAVEDLDKFPMPKYSLQLGIFSVFYNQATSMLEVTYRNAAEIATYFKSTINIFSAGNLLVVGDEEPVFIDGNEYKTILYEVDQLDPVNATAEFFTIFGESKKSLEFVLQGKYDIEFISIFDESSINITDIYYDSRANAFYVEVENIGDVDAYVDLELIDLWVNGEIITVGGDEVVFLKTDSKGKIKVSIELSEEDIINRNNQQIEVKGLYGQRENALIKLIRTSFEFRLKKFDMIYYVLILVLIILFFLILWKRKKKKKKVKKNKDHEHSA